MKEAKTVLYTSDECKRCHLIKAWLVKHGIAFETKNVALHDGWKEDGTAENMADFLLTVANRNDLPCLVINGVALQPVTAIHGLNPLRDAKVADACASGVCRL